MDNNSTEESPIGNEEFEATKDDVADEGRNIDEVSLVSMICSSSNLHSAGSYRKSNENIRNFAASRVSNPAEEGNPSGLHAGDSVCNTISAISLNNIEHITEHFDTNEDVDELTAAYLPETVLQGGSIPSLGKKDESKRSSDNFSNLAAIRSSNANKDDPTGPSASNSICKAKPAATTHGYNVEPTKEHIDSDEDKNNFITINFQETVLQEDSVRAETRKPSLIDHGQSRKSSYIIEGELDTIRCTTDLQRDAAEMSSIAIHGTHTKKEAPVSPEHELISGEDLDCMKTQSPERKLMLDVPSGTQGMLDEALDRMKTQLPQSLEFDIREEALAIVQDTANAYKKLLGKKHRLTVEAKNFMATVW